MLRSTIPQGGSLLFGKRMMEVFLFLLVNGILSAQTPGIDKTKFFTDDKVIEITLVSDFKKLIQEKLKPGYEERFYPTTITCLFPDSLKVTEEIEIRSRGKFRREKCELPPILVNFKTSKEGRLSSLGHLKLVWPCGNSPYDVQLLLKEYLAYKMFNLLTEKSFRVQLVKVTHQDINNKVKSATRYAFFLEDTDDLANRNGCVEIQPGRMNTEDTNREQTTLMTLFEYMIGNSDWTIAIQRNIKLIRSKEDSLSKPFAIPYDLDYSGLVNARYAVPPEGLPITSVRERYYLGFPRSMEELQAALQKFRSQRQAMESLIRNFAPLDENQKKEMVKYLGEFFDATEKQKDVNELFIKNARTE